MINYLEVDELMEIASIVLGETPQVRDFGLLSAAVVRPATVAFGQEAYPDLWTKAAALLRSVCVNRADRWKQASRLGGGACVPGPQRGADAGCRR